VNRKLCEHQSWLGHFEDISCHGRDSNLSTAYSLYQLCYPDSVGVVAWFKTQGSSLVMVLVLEINYTQYVTSQVTNLPKVSFHMIWVQLKGCVTVSHSRIYITIPVSHKCDTLLTKSKHCRMHCCITWHIFKNGSSNHCTSDG